MTTGTPTTTETTATATAAFTVAAEMIAAEHIHIAQNVDSLHNSHNFAVNGRKPFTFDAIYSIVVMAPYFGRVMVSPNDIARVPSQSRLVAESVGEGSRDICVHRQTGRGWSASASADSESPCRRAEQGLRPRDPAH